MGFAQPNTEGGIQKILTYFFLLWANVRGVGSASRERLPPFRLPLRRFGSCPADGTHKLLTTTWRTKGSSCSSNPRHCHLSVDKKSCRAPTEGRENDLALSWTASSRRRVADERRSEPSVSGGLKSDRVIDSALWWHVPGLPDTRQITEEAPALWCLLVHSSRWCYDVCTVIIILSLRHLWIHTSSPPPPPKTPEPVSGRSEAEAGRQSEGYGRASGTNAVGFGKASSKFRWATASISYRIRRLTIWAITCL